MVVWLLGYTPAMALAVIIGTALAFGVLLMLLPILSQRLFGTKDAGVIAAAAAIIIPTFKCVPQWDAVFVGLGLVVFCFVSLGIRRRAVGVLAGIIMLTNPTALLFMQGGFALPQHPFRFNGLV